MLKSLLLAAFWSFAEGKNPPGFRPLVEGRLWMAEAEVSVGEYQEFLLDLVRMGRHRELCVFAPDTSVWGRAGSGLGDISAHYFWHPSFSDYPVVGIPWEGAQAFCEWKTARARLERQGGDIRFRLPTLLEWQAASRLGTPEALFPGGLVGFPIVSKRFFNTRNDIGDAEFDGFLLTAPIRSEFFVPDKNGFFHLGGNAAEMTTERGIAAGGSWWHGIEFLPLDSLLEYSQPEAWVGFRLVCEKIQP